VSAVSRLTSPPVYSGLNLRFLSSPAPLGGCAARSSLRIFSNVPLGLIKPLLHLPFPIAVLLRISRQRQFASRNSLFPLFIPTGVSMSTPTSYRAGDLFRSISPFIFVDPSNYTLIPRFLKNVPRKMIQRCAPQIVFQRVN